MVIYLDNNATTNMPKVVISQFAAWANKGNPSASYSSALECQKLIRDFNEYVGAKCGFVPYHIGEKVTDATYQIIINSCASEANNTVLRAVISAYKYQTDTIPHIVTSSYEHKSLLDCVKQLCELGECEYTLVEPNECGFIDPDDVERAIKDNTCLITIMSANNEIGSMNDITAIGKIAHSHNVPFHTDAVQTFGKYGLNPIKCDVDAFSVSFHKLHGPPGMGALIIKRKFIEGFKLLPEICGSQNCGMRGGTENIMGIAASLAAVKYTWTNRQSKNTKLLKLRNRLISKIAERVPSQTHQQYLQNPLKKYPLVVVFLSGDINEKCYLPNTILLSAVKFEEPYMCNKEIKKSLEKSGIIISIGSACNTSNASASHVLTAIGADKLIKRGAIRVSIGDSNTEAEIDTFIRVYVDILKSAL